MQWFVNDGGPMLLLPRLAAAAWEGSDSPAAGRAVAATSRWDGGPVATDYDRACDVRDAAAAVPVAGSWAVVLRGDLAGSVAWLPDADRAALVAAAVAYADDDSPDYLRRMYAGVSPGTWVTVAAEVEVGEGGLLLLHAASPGGAAAVGARGPDGAAVIGDALAADVAPGRYVVEAAELEVPEAGVLFCRFRPVAAGAPPT